MNLFTQPLPSVVKCCRVMLDPRLICLMKTSYSQCKKREREREYEGEGESTNRIGRTACSCVCLLCVWFASCVSELPSRFGNWLDCPQNCPVFLLLWPKPQQRQRKDTKGRRRREEGKSVVVDKEGGWLRSTLPCRTYTHFSLERERGVVMVAH